MNDTSVVSRYHCIHCGMVRQLLGSSVFCAGVQYCLLSFRACMCIDANKDGKHGYKLTNAYMMHHEGPLSSWGIAALLYQGKLLGVLTAYVNA